ncbi:MULTISPECIES: hypothetical protein [unclassified Streptomyces]|uniref:hypothetical protein n=1 Tax=unclassified Streptomyces TaxID=2593676 RepID=UPI002E10508B|nr:hypothetical protein OG324_16915 [Streptomyces sp. NBC_01236]
MRRRRRTGPRRIKALQRVRDKVLRQRENRRAGLARRIGRRAERARPWLQFVADLTTLLARLVR